MERTSGAGAAIETDEEIVRIALVCEVVGVERPRAGGQVESVMLFYGEESRMVVIGDVGW